VLRATGRLVRADLAKRPLQSILTGLVVAIAAGALLVTLHLRAVLDEPFDDLMLATNGAHVSVMGAPDAVARAAARPEVAQAGEPRRTVRVAVDLPHGRARLVLSGLSPRASIDRPLAIAGRLPEARGEVAIIRPLALDSGWAPGAELPLADGQRLKVVGVAVLALSSADAWVTPDQARALTPAAAAPGEPALRATVAEVPLRLKDPDAAAAFAKQLEAGDVRVGNWLDARRDFTDESRRTLAILGASTLLALLAAGFTLATAIGGRVLAERRRIGLLRAIGVTPRGVTGVLVAYYLAVAVLAAPFGLLVGWLLAPPLLSDTVTLLGTPEPGAPGPALALAVLGLVLLAVTLATALSAWRAGRLPPVVALESGRGAANERASRAARAARALHLPVVAMLGAKDAYVQRGRAVLTIASLALAGMVVVCALAFEATMDRLAADPGLRAQPWDISVDTDGMRADRVDRLLDSVPGVAAVARRYTVPALAGGIQVEARVLDGSPTAFPFAVPDGRGVARAGEVTLGRGAIETLGLRIGDEVRMSAAGRPFTARLVGRHVEPDADGRGAVVLAATMPPAALGRPGWVLQLDRGTDPVGTEHRIAELGGGRLFVRRPAEAVDNEVSLMRPIVYGVTALLLAIAGVNLLTTLLLGVRERRRDVAILGAVGATRRQMTATVVAGGVVLAVPGLVAGLPLGVWMFRTLVGITDPSDGPDVVTLPSWWVVALALPVALAAVAVVSAAAAREAGRVAVPVALRAE
jgi:putative ABC transport system permease protein